LPTARKILDNPLYRLVIIVALIMGILACWYAALVLALGTTLPVRVVESGSMCVSQKSVCDGWSHPFDQTLHIGDVVFVQAINPADLNSNYPNSDVIVFDRGSGQIFQRIVDKQEINGTLYFKTKADGAGPVLWPNATDSYDFSAPDSRGIPESMVEGRVVMRIPWVGDVFLFFRDNTWALIVLFVVVSFVLIVRFLAPPRKQRREELQNRTFIGTRL
jgi:hypothetical protein